MLVFISRYGLAVHLALAAVAPLFLSPIPSLYLAALAAVWMLFEPSRIGSESLHEARARIQKAMVRDVLFWVLLVAIVFAGIRFFNTGIERAYDAETSSWFISPPIFPIMPASIGDTGLRNFAGVITLSVVLLAVRNALGRSGRFAFLTVSSFLAAIGAFVSVFLLSSGSEALRLQAMASFENPDFIGSTYGFYLLAAVQGLAASFERRGLGALPFAILGLSGTALGLFSFSPPIVTVIFAIAAVILFMANFVVIRINLGNPTEFKYLVVLGLSLAGVVFAVLLAMPKGVQALKLAPYIDSASLIPVEWRDQFAPLAAIAKKIWIQSPWLGSGLGSFPLNLSFTATSADWAVISPVQSAPLSGYWMLLAERGTIGAFLFVAISVILWVTFVRRLLSGVHHLPHPIALMGPLAFLLALAELVGDVSILRPEALIACSGLFALSAHGFVKESSHG